jgi:hypothetical protein
MYICVHVCVPARSNAVQSKVFELTLHDGEIIRSIRNFRQCMESMSNRHHDVFVATISVYTAKIDWNARRADHESPLKFFDDTDMDVKMGTTFDWQALTLNGSHGIHILYMCSWVCVFVIYCLARLHGHEV